MVQGLAVSLSACALLGAGLFLLGREFLDVLIWWLFLLGLGLLYLPLGARLFSGFIDRGYPFCKVIGLLAAAYLTWLAASLHVLPFSRGAIAFFAVAPALSLRLLGPAWGASALRRALSGRVRLLLVQELLFLGVLTGWAFVRGLQPDVSGLEKFMDYGFGASIFRSATMPPPDMWFSGEPINYYYFGHYSFALLAKLTGIRLPVAYNLMIATLAALCFSLTFSLAASLVRGWKPASLGQCISGGIVSALLLTFGGNLHGAVYGHALPALERLDLIEGPFGSEYQQRTGDYWYPDASRYVGHNPPTDGVTIHEFPFYSFVVADLHGHVANIPFVLTFLALLTASLLGSTPGEGGRRAWRSAALLALGSGFLLAVFRMTNMWDLPIYFCVAAAFCLCEQVIRWQSVARGALVAALAMTGAAIGSWAFALPFVLRFERYYGELGWVHSHTPPHQLLVLWGLPFFFVALHLVPLLHPANLRRGLGTALRAPSRGLASLARADLVAVLLVAAALGLLLVPEIVYVKSIYTASHYRGNTYFKLTYQAFVLFGVVIGHLAVRFFAVPGGRVRSFVVTPVATLMLALPLLYTALGIRGYYGEPWPDRFRGLDGLAFLDRAHPDDSEAIRWLNAHVSGSPTILEAHGDSYTEYGRVSMATGLPTVLGWYVHEWLWRGGHEQGDARIRDISAVYESGDRALAGEILRRYGVEFIVIGDLERAKFPALKESEILASGSVVFESPRTRIVRIRP